jgi:hypothetical protein
VSSLVEAYDYLNGVFCLHYWGTTTRKIYSEMEVVTALVFSTAVLTISHTFRAALEYGFGACLMLLSQLYSIYAFNFALTNTSY